MVGPGHQQGKVESQQGKVEQKYFLYALKSLRSLRNVPDRQTLALLFFCKFRTFLWIGIALATYYGEPYTSDS